MFFALLNGTFGISAASTADINSREVIGLMMETVTKEKAVM